MPRACFLCTTEVIAKSPLAMKRTWAPGQVFPQVASIHELLGDDAAESQHPTASKNCTMFGCFIFPKSILLAQIVCPAESCLEAAIDPVGTSALPSGIGFWVWAHTQILSMLIA